MTSDALIECQHNNTEWKQRNSKRQQFNVKQKLPFV